MRNRANCGSAPFASGSTFVVGAVVDESEQALRLCAALGATEFDLEVQAPHGEALLEATPRLDAVVLYQRCDRGSAVGTVRAAKDSFPETPLIAVWATHHNGEARKALHAGADGLISDDELETTLAPTLRAVLSGVVCVPARMRAPLETESLSMREKQVLSMVVTGSTNAEIATRLFLAESTVKSHLSSAYTKLGVCSRKDAASRILDPGQGLGPGILAISAA